MVPCKENDISNNMEETKEHSEVMVHLILSSFIRLKIVWESACCIPGTVQRPSISNRALP